MLRDPQTPPAQTASMSAGATPVWLPGGDGCAPRRPLPLPAAACRRSLAPPHAPPLRAAVQPRRTLPLALALTRPAATPHRRTHSGIPALKIRDEVAEGQLVGSEGLVVCLREDTGEELVVPRDVLCHREELPPGGGVDDLTQLTFLNEASILDNLHRRYEQSGEDHTQRPRIYTYCGRICLAANPFQPVRRGWLGCWLGCLAVFLAARCSLSC